MTHKKIKGDFQTYVSLFEDLTDGEIKELMIFNEHIEPILNSKRSNCGRLTVEFKVVKKDICEDVPSIEDNCVKDVGYEGLAQYFKNERRLEEIVQEIIGKYIREKE